MYAGLILTLLREDMMTMVITSGVISLGSLIAWIISLVGREVGFGYRVSVFLFGPLFFFLLFGAIAIVVFVKAERFRQMRAASAASRTMAGIACPKCGAFVPANAGFCPVCGAQNPAMQQYGPVQQPQYAPPVQPQYAPPVQPQYAPPAQPQYAPPAPEAAPAAAPKCVNCGADIVPGAAFCAQCGAKQ
jgi:RNA polymerase subunit RPABC4/transcription elongation factor Spt4